MHKPKEGYTASEQGQYVYLYQNKAKPLDLGPKQSEPRIQVPAERSARQPDGVSSHVSGHDHLRSIPNGTSWDITCPKCQDGTVTHPVL